MIHESLVLKFSLLQIVKCQGFQGTFEKLLGFETNADPELTAIDRGNTALVHTTLLFLTLLNLFAHL